MASKRGIHFATSENTEYRYLLKRLSCDPAAKLKVTFSYHVNRDVTKDSLKLLVL